jgi:hypothetical protein
MTERRALLRLLRIAYLIGGAALLAWMITRRREAIGDLLVNTRLIWLAAALVMSFGMLALAAQIWQRMLAAQGEQVSFAPVLHATARAVLARYIPGSIWFAVGRASLLSRLGIGAGALTVTAATEIVLSIATTLAGGALLLGLLGALPGGGLWSLGASLALIGVASPAVAGRLTGWVARSRRVAVPAISWSDYLEVVIATLAFWVWSALTFAVYLRAFPLADDIETLMVLGGFLFAWGIGFLAFVAPQGLGVFELTLATILVSQGVPETAIVIGGYRVVILIRDAIAATAAEASARRGDRFADPKAAEST